MFEEQGSAALARPSLHHPAMTFRRRSTILRVAASPVRHGVSWLALLASTTLGVDGSTVRAHVKANAGEVDDRSAYRLVVQTYDGPMKGSRPVGSVQRVVTGAELRRGIDVSVVELRESGKTQGKELVVAWIEDNTRELELDARQARPPRGSVHGAVRKAFGADSVRIALGRSAARPRRLAA
jgi:hypothetical protein